MSKFWRRFEVFFCAFILIGLSGMNISGASTMTTNVPPQPTRVYAVGGLESATVFWTMPESKTSSPVSKYKILIFDAGKAQYQTASDATAASCPAGVSKCVLMISNPTRNRIAKPNALNFFFTVAAINDVGVGPDSIRTTLVSVTFKPTVSAIPTPTPKPKSTPTPTPTVKPKVTQTPTPVVKPKATPTPTKSTVVAPATTTNSIAAFDGLYSGSAVVGVSINSGAATSANYSATFTLRNGEGAGSAEGWTVAGRIIDAKGVASVTASSAIYGSLTFTVNFVQDPVTHVMTGSGNGERTETLTGIGEVKVNFVYSVSRKS